MFFYFFYSTEKEIKAQRGSVGLYFGEQDNVAYIDLQCEMKTDIPDF